MSSGVLKLFLLDGGYYTLHNLMLVIKDSASKQTQRQPGGREGSQVGMGSAPSGDHTITPCRRFKTEYLMRP